MPAFHNHARQRRKTQALSTAYLSEISPLLTKDSNITLFRQMFLILVIYSLKAHLQIKDFGNLAIETIATLSLEAQESHQMSYNKIKSVTWTEVSKKQII